LIASFLMMLSVTFAFWGVATFIPTYVGGVAAKLGGSAPEFAGYASMIPIFAARSDLSRLAFSRTRSAASRR